MVERDAVQRAANIEFRKRYAVDDRASWRDHWQWVDQWAFDDWPDLEAVHARLEKCVARGALGAAIDAIMVVREHHRCFWKRLEKPMRPTDQDLLDIAERLPDFPMWATEAVARKAVDRSGVASHRMNIIHRLRFWAVSMLEDLRTAEREERRGSEDIPPLCKQLAQAGMPEMEAKARADEELRRFTPDLLGDRIYDRAVEIFADTPLAPRRSADSPGDGDTFRASVRKVREARSRGDDDAAAFYLPSDAALWALGWSDLAGLTVEIDRRIGRLFRSP